MSADGKRRACGFSCPTCDGESFPTMDDWLDHMRSEHGVNGPL